MSQGKKIVLSFMFTTLFMLFLIRFGFFLEQYGFRNFRPPANFHGKYFPFVSGVGFIIYMVGYLGLATSGMLGLYLLIRKAKEKIWKKNDNFK